MHAFVHVCCKLKNPSHASWWQWREKSARKKNENKNDTKRIWEDARDAIKSGARSGEGQAGGSSRARDGAANTGTDKWRQRAA